MSSRRNDGTHRRQVTHSAADDEILTPITQNIRRTGSLDGTYLSSLPAARTITSVRLRLSNERDALTRVRSYQRKKDSESIFFVKLTQELKMQSPVVIPFNYSYAALSVNVSVPPRMMPYVGVVPPRSAPTLQASSPETVMSVSRSPVSTTSPTSAMKSFSIEAILGLNNQSERQLQCPVSYATACHPQFRSLPDIGNVYPGHGQYHFAGNLPLSPINQHQEQQHLYGQQTFPVEPHLYKQGKLHVDVASQRRHQRLEAISRPYPPQQKSSPVDQSSDDKSKGKRRCQIFFVYNLVPIKN